MLDELIKERSKINIKTLIKIKNLLEFIAEIKNRKIEKNKEDLIKTIENIYYSEDYILKFRSLSEKKIKNDVFDIRIASIMKTYKYEDYTKKILKEYYTIYEYPSKTVFYIKKDCVINIERFKFSLEEDLNNYKFVNIYCTVLNYRVDKEIETKSTKKLKKKTYLSLMKP